MPRLSPHARAEWLTILVVGVLLTASAVMVGWWWLGLFILPAAALGVYAFRDPDRNPPVQRNVAVSPADGKVVSVHELPSLAAFDGKPATCVRVYLSLLDVHIQRNPCHGKVASIKHRKGRFQRATNPASVEENEATLTVLRHPLKEHPVAAVRQVAGMVARTIVTTADKGDVLQRGQRLGLIKLGSMVELYLPTESVVRVAIAPGQRVVGGETIVAELHSPQRQESDDGAEPSADASEQSEETNAVEADTATGPGVETQPTLYDDAPEETDGASGAEPEVVITTKTPPAPREAEPAGAASGSRGGGGQRPKQRQQRGKKSGNRPRGKSSNRSRKKRKRR